MIRLTILLFLGPGVASAAAAQPIIVLIGGNHSDPSPAQLAGRSGRGGNSGLWRLKGDLKAHERWDAEYFNWNGTPAGRIDDSDPGGAKRIAQFVREEHARRSEAPIILVGNSWGGHTAWEVCQRLNGGTDDEDGTLVEPPSASETPSAEPPDTPATPAGVARRPVVPVDLVILIDPSSLGRGKDPMPRSLPDNVKRAVNYYTHNAFGWRGQLKVPRLTNVDMGDPQHGFLVPGGPPYDSAFNLSAHIAAEWDERLHAAIRQEMVDVVDAPENSPEE